MRAISDLSGDRSKIDMKITINNLGPIKKGTIETGDLTIITGGNNTGKSHLAYAVWYAQEAFINNGIDSPYKLDEPIEDAIEKIFNNRIEGLNVVLNEEVRGKLGKLFLPTEMTHNKVKTSQYLDSEVSMKQNLEISNFLECIKTVFEEVEKDYRNNSSKISREEFLLHYANQFKLTPMTLLINELNTQAKQGLNKDFIDNLLLRSYKKLLFPNKHYLLTSERAAALAYERYINGYSRMPRANLTLIEPVRYNIQWFAPELAGYQASPVNEWFTEKGVEDLFSKITGGRLQLVNGTVSFVPSEWVGETREPLPFHLLSASQRNIAAIYFCLRHMITGKDILIIDEPESYLHPENQRLLARIIAIAANSGIKIMITTHSDYILNELSLLIMMGCRKEKDHIRSLMEKEKYTSHEILDVTERKVQVYEMEKEDDGSFKPAYREITPERGVLIKSINEQISKMNRLEDEIVFGSDDE